MKGEIHDAQAYGKLLDHTRRREQRITLPRVGGRLLQPRGIFGEAERVRGADVQFQLFGRSLVEEEVAIVVRADATVIVAGGADVEIADEFFTDVRVSARLAFLPHIRGDLESVATGFSRLFFLPEPGHRRGMWPASPCRARD
jgi:hypothetical protein